MTRWLALALAVGALFLASWVFIPAPTYFLLTFGVGAPEVSPWIVLGALVAVALAIRDVRRSNVARTAVALGGLAFALAAWPLMQFPGAARALDAAMNGKLREPASPARTTRFSLRDFTRGIDVGKATITRGVAMSDAGGVLQSIDVYQPTTAGRHPVLVQIYGGAWQRGRPADNANFATMLASHGWVVFAIDYRHAPAFRWTDIVGDVDAWLRFIRDHAAQYDGDTSRVVLMGRSAGAHLAMMAAFRTPAPLRVRGVVSYYGPADLAQAYRNPPRPDPLRIRSVEEAFIGGTLDERPQEYAAASPVSYITRPLPPTLLVYGRRDHIVEARFGTQLRDRLAASGTPVAYLEIPWAEHAFDAVFNGVSSQLALYYVERFLTWSVHSQ